MMDDFLETSEPESGPSGRAREVRRSRLPTALPLLGILVLITLLLPTLVLLLHQPWSSLARVWHQRGLVPLWVSLETTGVAMLVMVAFGTPLGLWLARGGSGSRWVEYALLLPLLMPPLVVGLTLADILGPYGLVGPALGALKLSGTNSALAVVVAEIFEAMPYYVLAVVASVRQVPRSLEEAAWMLGYRPLKALWRVTVPLAWPGLLAGLAMAFARSVGAFGAVIVVAYYPHTLPVAIWIGLQEQGLSQAFPLALLLLLVALPAPLILYLWRRMPHAQL